MKRRKKYAENIDADAIIDIPLGQGPSSSTVASKSLTLAEYLDACMKKE